MLKNLHILNIFLIFVYILKYKFMNKNDLIAFLNERPGYLKKGNDVLREVLSNRGFDSSNLSDEDFKQIKRNLKNLNIKSYKKSKKVTKPKVLFYDIETSYNIAKTWRVGYNINLNHNDIIHERAIICVSYKWQGEDKVHTLKWDNGCDKKLVTKFMEVLNEADELVGHNIDRYDTKFLRTRALKHGIATLPKYVSYDTLKQARKHFNFNSNKLDYIAKFLGLGGKLKHAGLPMWDDIVLYCILNKGKSKKYKKSLSKMIKYCEKDVILTEEVFNKLKAHTDRNTHHGVQMGYSKLTCPGCGSNNLKLIKTQTTKSGMIRRIMECQDCKERFLMSNTNYLKLIK